LFPYSPDAWNSYGRTLTLEGKTDLSKNAYARAENIQRLEDSLMAMISVKRYSDAENIIKKIRKESPDRVVFTPSRIGPLFGEAFRSQMYDHALNICRLWILGNPLAAGPYFSMSRVLVKTGKTQEAVECYQKIIRLFPGQSAEAAKKELESLEK
jgi:tetratricopeptide (TPR) repeat protein